MKCICLILAIALSSLTVNANEKCLATAEQIALAYWAGANTVETVSSVKIEESFFVEQSRQVLYYGVQLDSRDSINVGLRAGNCALVSVNFVAGHD